jgi:rubrerythrin
MNKTTIDYLIEAQDYITSMSNPNDRTEYQILKEINSLIQKAINHLEKKSEMELSLKTKKGKWLKVGGYFTPGGDPVWMCSECGKGIHVYGIEANSYNSDITDGHQWVACPNCGAEME